MAPRVALTHAGGLVAEAILERLSESGLAPDSLVLLDHESRAGNRLAYAGTHLTSLDQREFDYTGCAVVLLAETDPELVASAEAQGCLVVSHTLPADTGALFLAPGFAEPALSYSTSRARLVGAELACLLPALVALEQLAAFAQVNITLLRSAELHGKAGVDELASQTVSLLNARPVEASVYAQQIAFNVIPERPDPALAEDLATFLGNSSCSTQLQSVNVPVFHGLAAAVQIAFAEELDSERARQHLMQLENLVIEDTNASLVERTNRSFDCVLSDWQPTGGEASQMRFWLMADPMRYGLAKNFVNVLDFLLKSFL